MTKTEREHYDKLHNLGCIACYVLGYGNSPAEIHHIRHETGAGRKAAFNEAIPLCPRHHRLGGYGIAYHSGRLGFERHVGMTEVELLELTNKLLERQNHER